jgi:hypothetical protein
MLVGSADGPLGHALGQDRFGFSITHAFKKVGHGITSAGKEAGHLTKKYGLKVGELAVLPVAELNKIVAGPILRVALRPIKSRVNTLKSRRANKLAYDRGHPTPTPQDQADARSWTRNKVKHQIPFGPVFYALAGAPTPSFFGYAQPAPVTMFGDPTTATIVASIPPMIKLMDDFIKSSSKSGEAPAHVGRGGAGSGAAPSGGDAGGGADAGAADDSGDAGGGSGAGGGKGKHGGHGGKGGGAGGKMMMLPGIGAVPKTAVYVGGGLLALVLLIAITKKS